MAYRVEGCESLARVVELFEENAIHYGAFQRFIIPSPSPTRSFFTSISLAFWIPRSCIPCRLFSEGVEMPDPFLSNPSDFAVFISP